MSVGRYITDKNAAIFKDLALYGTATVLSDVSGQANYVTDVYVGPGLRFGMGQERKAAFSFGVQVPITGPQTYLWQPNLSFILKYRVGHDAVNCSGRHASHSARGSHHYRRRAGSRRRRRRRTSSSAPLVALAQRIGPS